MSHRADYRAVIELLLGPTADIPGIDDAILTAAEERLGLQIPKALRDYLAFAGGPHDLNRTHDRLIPLDQLDVDDGVLVFYVENQGVVVWGIPLDQIAEDDPPVLQAQNEPAKQWESFAVHVSQFLVLMLYWQAANGALAVSANCWADRDLVLRIRNSWSMLIRHHSGRVYGAPGQVLYIEGEYDEGFLFVGARSSELFHAICAAVGDVEWDYNSLTDDGQG